MGSPPFAAAQEDQVPATVPETVVEAEATPEVPVFDEIIDTTPSPVGATPFSPGDIIGYGAAGAVTGTKIAVPPLDFPGSIQVVPRDLIDDQSADSLNDLLHDVSGLAPSIGGSAGRTDDLLIRGFRVQGNMDDFRKNGFRDSSRVQRELANIDRIEVLKGPAAVLYGAVGEPSGLVNFITKQPLDYRFDRLAIRFGYFDDYRLTFDSTGPLLTDAPVYYRLNIAAADTDSFRDFVFNEKFFIAPVIRWDVGDRTRLTLEGEFLYDERMTDRGIPLFQDSLKSVPINRFLGEPTDGTRFNDGQVSLILDHEIDDTWTARCGWVSNWSDENRVSTDTRRAGTGGGGGGGGGGSGGGGSGGGGSSAAELRRRTVIQDALDQNHYFIGDIAGKVPLFCMEHNLLAGVELGVTNRDDFTLQGNATNIDIFNPVYGQPQPVPTDTRNQAFDNEQYAIYLQDLISVTDRFKLLLGVRHDWVDSTTLDTNMSATPLTGHPTAWNLRFGVVYHLVEDVMSVYASYSESFEPLLGTSLAGDDLSRNVENRTKRASNVSCSTNSSGSRSPHLTLFVAAFSFPTRPTRIFPFSSARLKVEA
jgi:iron complex outermembrane receptor protein